MKLVLLTVEVAAPGPFTDAEADAFIEAVQDMLLLSIQAAADGVLDAARSRRVPLADVARVSVDG